MGQRDCEKAGTHASELMTEVGLGDRVEGSCVKEEEETSEVKRALIKQTARTHQCVIVRLFVCVCV